MKAYVASGWFTPAQEMARLSIIECLKIVGIEYYSPKDDLLYVPGKNDPHHVFATNMGNIDECTVMVASTEGKDMGTVFECGAAYQIGKPIIYLWERPGPFNLMLAQSAHYVATSKRDLIMYLKANVPKTHIMRIPYEGEQE